MSIKKLSIKKVKKVKVEERLVDKQIAVAVSKGTVGAI